MSQEVVIVKIFSHEAEAEMAQQLLHDAGVQSFIFKDDAGGMEPYLQLTHGVRLVINREDAVRAQEILRDLEDTN